MEELIPHPLIPPQQLLNEIGYKNSSYFVRGALRKVTQLNVTPEDGIIC